MANRPRSLLWPALVAALTLGITAWVWNHEHESQDQVLRGQFDFGVRQTATRIGERIAAYEQMLRGVRGLFDASAEVTQQDFLNYVDALLTGADVAGLRSIAYLPWREPAAAAVAYTAPAPDPLLLAPGLDLWSEPLRRQPLMAARDSGGVAMSRRILGPKTADGTQESAFLMCMAIYRGGAARGSVEQRRAFARGWICASFRIGDLMSSLYGEGTPGLVVDLHDGTDVVEGTRMAGPGPDADAGGGRTPRFSATEYLGVAGQAWTLAMRSSADFDRRHANDVRAVLAATGVGLSLALALLTWLLVTSRDRATATARAMTHELRDSAERYRRIVETADEGIWMSDAAGLTTFVNPKLQQMLGRDAHELLARPWTEHMDPADRAVLQGGAVAAHLRHEVSLQRGDGSELRAALSVSPIPDEAGRPTGRLAMVTDVTEARRAEARRVQLEEQLRQSQKMEAIGTLAGGIAHDFNNLLAAVLGNVAQVQQALGGAHPQAARLDQIRQAASRGRSLVQQIVAFSRQQPQQRTVLALRPLIEESATLLRSTLPALVQLDLQLSDDALLVNADATQLQQVLLNLCTNAWHAMAGRPGRIVVGLEAVIVDAPAGAAGPLRQARVWVADDGSGMDASTRERVFEPFFTTKPVGQGTGLGLAAVHGIVASHGGVITVDSEPGHGSCFDMRFPLVEPEAGVAEIPTQPATVPIGQGEHVLYVDDDPLVGVMVEALLQRAGYRVTCMEDPQQALALATATTADDVVDLVVTDYNMPAMSGLDLARALHRARPMLPVLITTGFVSDELRHEARQAGVVSVLQKEYTLEQLVPLVHGSLAAR